MTEVAGFTIPEHIPSERVVDFDMYGGEQFRTEPHRRMLEWLAGGIPSIFYTPRNGGHWVVTGAVEALEMLMDSERFSSHPRYNELVRKPRTLPNQADPPAHTAYRSIINPVFTQKAAAEMNAQLRSTCVSLIDELRPRGGCEFIADFSKRFPVDVFLGMVNAPMRDRDALLDWADTTVRHPDRETRNASAAKIGEYVMKLYAERRGAPGDDLLSRVLAGRVPGNIGEASDNGTHEGRPLDDPELLGMGILLFLAGLDTVAATLAFIMLHLGRQPAQYARLVNERALIDNATSELLRRYGVASMLRGVSRDTEYRGIQFRQNDRLFFVTQLFGVDARRTPNPLEVDFDRRPGPVLSFGAGPHRCVGAHLARAEVKAFVEEWTLRIPRFRVAVEGEVPTVGGHVWSPVSLPLTWT